MLGVLAEKWLRQLEQLLLCNERHPAPLKGAHEGVASDLRGVTIHARENALVRESPPGVHDTRVISLHPHSWTPLAQEGPHPSVHQRELSNLRYPPCPRPPLAHGWSADLRRKMSEQVEERRGKKNCAPSSGSEGRLLRAVVFGVAFGIGIGCGTMLGGNDTRPSTPVSITRPCALGPGSTGRGSSFGGVLDIYASERTKAYTRLH